MFARCLGVAQRTVNFLNKSGTLLFVFLAIHPQQGMDGFSTAVNEGTNRKQFVSDNSRPKLDLGGRFHVVEFNEEMSVFVYGSHFPITYVGCKLTRERITTHVFAKTRKMIQPA